MRRRLSVAVLAAVTAIAGSALALTGAAAQSGGGPAQTGRFLAPFEDTATRRRRRGVPTDADGRKLCKPAGATVVALSDGKVLYWDALEGTENVDISVVIECGKKQRNARTRTIDLVRRHARLRHADAGGRRRQPRRQPRRRAPAAAEHRRRRRERRRPVLLRPGAARRRAHPRGRRHRLVQRPRDPRAPTSASSSSRASRTRASSTPAPTSGRSRDRCSYGRWYPSLVTLPDGKMLVASGVSKLVKPLYPDRPFDSGTNVKQLEMYDPATGDVDTLPETANRSLPLFPRLHLLPNGHVYYDVAGQSFNPFGQAYDEAFWNIGATFDPATEPLDRPRRPGPASARCPGCPTCPARERRPRRAPAARQPARSTDCRTRTATSTSASGSGARRSRSCCRSSPTPTATTPGVVPDRGRTRQRGGCRRRARSSAPTCSRVNTVTIDPAPAARRWRASRPAR